MNGKFRLPVRREDTSDHGRRFGTEIPVGFSSYGPLIRIKPLVSERPEKAETGGVKKG